MRYSTFLIAIVTFFVFGVPQANCQDSYPITFGGSQAENAWTLYEDTLHDRFLVFGTQYDPALGVSSKRGVVYSIGYNLDTCRYFFHSNSPDTCWRINFGLKRDEGGFLLIGVASGSPDYSSNTRFLFVLTDDSLNMLSYKSYSPEWYNEVYYSYPALASIGPFIYQIGFVNEYQSYNKNTYLIKIDYSGNVILADTLPKRTPPTTHLWQILQGTDPSTIWVVGNGYKGEAYDCCTALDTLFNVMWARKLPVPSIYISMMKSKLRWVSDTSLIMMSQYTYLDFLRSTQDDDLGFSEIDTSFAFQPVTYYGAPDTIDNPADNQCFDFRNPDTIFFAGMHNLDFLPWPHEKNWVMTGQLDRQFNARYIRYFGGDASYRVMTIGATSDGGVMVVAWRYDWPAQNSEGDIVVWKLDAEGLITGTNSPQSQLDQGKLALLYPNPGSDQLIIECGAPSGTLLLNDMMGNQIITHLLHQGTNAINTSSLASGTYFYRIIFSNKEIMNGTWIKK